MAEDIVIDLPSRSETQPPGSLAFIGTATVLIRYAGFTVLTDPNFLHKGQRAYLGYGLTSKRLTEPAVTVDKLPPLDLILLSHLHGDHFDRVAKAGLDKTVPIVTTRQAAEKLRDWGFQAIPLHTWQSITLRRPDASLRVSAMPARHGRGPIQTALPPVMGAMLEFTSGWDPAMRLYITGDTLFVSELKEIARRYSDIDVNVVHLGGTRIGGLLVTMDAKQGRKLLGLIDADVTIPVHYDDYGVFKSPLRDFLRAVKKDPPRTRVIALRRGNRVPLPVPPPSGGFGAKLGVAGLVVANAIRRR